MYTPKMLNGLLSNYMNQNSFQLAPQELLEPVNYILQLGGKRLRPLLMLMTYNLYKEDVKAALPAAYAYEIFHNFSLVHDDIMDEAAIRRGQTTIHKKYGINTGILSGDVMLIYAYRYLSQITNKGNLSKIVNIFNKTATDVCIGQQYDMNFETEDAITVEEYLKMIEYKTASLIASSMKTGAILAEVDDKDCNHIFEFGRNIGIAFQLQDDILDTFGNAATFGKRIGGDIVQNKKTYLVIKALELANVAQKKQLQELLSTIPEDEATKIKKVTELFNALHIKEIANKKKEEYHVLAMNHLQAVNVSKDKKLYLMELAKSLLKRKY